MGANASFVMAFAHVRRASGGTGLDLLNDERINVQYKAGKPGPFPSQFVHKDLTMQDAVDHLRKLLGQMLHHNTAQRKAVVEALNNERRFAFVNVWRPVAVVECMPLACADALTVEAGDLVEGDERLAKNRSRHEWYYFPRMTPDEV